MIPLFSPVSSSNHKEGPYFKKISAVAANVIMKIRQIFFESIVYITYISNRIQGTESKN